MEDFTPVVRYKHRNGMILRTEVEGWRFASYYSMQSHKLLTPSEQRVMTEKINKVKINFINKTIEHYIYWQNPVKDINEPIRLAYDNSLGQKQIKRMIEKINSHDFIIKKLMTNAEQQLVHLKYLKKHILSDIHNDKETIKQFVDTITKKFDFYFQYYIQLRDYYNRLPEYKIKYENLFNVVRSGKQCRICLKYANVKRPKFVCEPCILLKKAESIIHECPVCLEEVPHENKVFTSCDGKHVLCITCFTTLSKYSNKCPLCRGPL